MSALQQQQRRLQFINDKGWEVAQKLMQLKSKQKLELGHIKGVTMDDTSDPPEVRLRRYLDQINRARARLQAKDKYGSCLGCGAAFSDLQLDEMPWVEHCASCDAR